MNQMREFDVKRWARLVKTYDDVRDIRKIVCYKCQRFKKVADDNRYAHGGCQYYIQTGEVRAWSILACIDRGSFVPKMNVNTEKVNEKIEEWINKRRGSRPVGNMRKGFVGRSDGRVCDAKLSHDAFYSGEDDSHKERMSEV